MSGKVDDDLSMQLEAAPGDMFSFVRISWCEGDAEGLVDNDAAFARAAAAAAGAEAIDDPAFRDPTTRCARVTSFKGNLRDAKKYFELVFLRKTGSNWKGATHCYAEVPAARRGTLRYRVAGAVATSGATAASGATFSSTAALMPYSLLQSWAKKRGIKANATLAVLRAAWVAAMEAAAVIEVEEEEDGEEEEDDEDDKEESEDEEEGEEEESDGSSSAHGEGGGAASASAAAMPKSKAKVVPVVVVIDDRESGENVQRRKRSEASATQRGGFDADRRDEEEGSGAGSDGSSSSGAQPNVSKKAAAAKQAKQAKSASESKIKSILRQHVKEHPPNFKALQPRLTLQTNLPAVAKGCSFSTKHAVNVAIRENAEGGGFLIMASKIAQRTKNELVKKNQPFTDISGSSTPLRLSFRCQHVNCSFHIVASPSIEQVKEEVDIEYSSESEDDEASSEEIEYKVSWVIKTSLDHNHPASATVPGSKLSTNYTTEQLAHHVIITGGDDAGNLKSTAIVSLLQPITLLKVTRHQGARIRTKVVELLNGNRDMNYRTVGSLAAAANRAGHVVEIYTSTLDEAQNIVETHLRKEHKYEFSHVKGTVLNEDGRTVKNPEYFTFDEWIGSTLKDLKKKCDQLDPRSRVYRGMVVIPFSAIQQWPSLLNYCVLDAGHMQGSLSGIVYHLTGADGDRKSVNLGVAHFMDNESADTAKILLVTAAKNLEGFLTKEDVDQGTTTIDGGTALVSACRSVFSDEDGVLLRNFFQCWRHRRARAGQKGRIKKEYDAFVQARSPDEVQNAYDCAAPKMKKFLDKYEWPEQAIILAGDELDGRGTNGICEAEMAADLKGEKLRFSADPQQFLLKLLEGDRRRALEREANALSFAGLPGVANSNTEKRVAKLLAQGSRLTVKMDATELTGKVQMLSDPTRFVTVKIPALVGAAAGVGAAGGGSVARSAADVGGTCSCNTSSRSKELCVHLVAACAAVRRDWHELLPMNHTRGYLKTQYSGLNFKDTYPIVSTEGLKVDQGVVLIAPIGIRAKAGRPKGKGRKKSFSDWMKKTSGVGPKLDRCHTCGGLHGAAACRV